VSADASGVDVESGGVEAGGDAGGDTGYAGPASDADAASANRAACDRAFDVLYVGCAEAQFPQAELDRLRPGFESNCQQTLAQPGSATSGDDLVTCLQGIADAGCRTTPTLETCMKPGSLPADAGCLNNSQCLSSTCLFQEVVQGPDGGWTEPTCGSCAPLLAAGKPLPPTQLDAGAICAWGDECAPGLVCNELRSRCMPLGAQGDPCGWTPDCLAPLVCSNAVCRQPGDAGASCLGDPDCAHGLVCDTVVQRCGTVVWGAPGQRCGGLVRCAGYFVNCTSSSTTATCPNLLGEGQPCTPGDTTQFCDVYLACLNDTCTPAPLTACP
jgi:hypothetical protein